MNPALRRWFILFVLFFPAGLTWPAPPARAATPPPPGAVEDFPIFSEIKPNVAFWIDVFTKYDQSQGIVHDIRDLSKQYSIIPLDPAVTRAAAKKNTKRKKTALKSHKALLLALAGGTPPATPDEKRIAALFGPKPDPKALERAAHNLRIQTGLRQQFKDGLIRSGALVDEFKKIFNSYGLPRDLVFLPCVESSFNVKAYSKFGAAGLWQFTRGTGKRYMEIGYVVDQRRDPFVSTHGAAKLLKRNFTELSSWPLAITAYNHGLNGMKRAKKRHATYPRIYRDYKSPSFKFASRNFYSEFLAARHVAKNHKQYFGDLKLATPVSHTRLITGGYVPAKDLSRELNVAMEVLQDLNPSLRNPVFDGRKHIPKGFELRLPPGISREAAKTAMAGLYEEKQRPSRFHRVQRGDTAGAIARTHGVSLNDLIMANSLDRRAAIYIGQTLRIPAADKAMEKPKKQKAKSKAPSRQIQKTDQPVPAKPAPKIQKPEARLVAKASSVPKAAPPKKAEQIEADPKGGTAPSRPGEARPLPAGETGSLSIVTADLKIQRHFKENGSPFGLIHVAPEETLGHYADWLKIPTQKIRALNRLPYGNVLSVGQTVKLPLSSKTAPAFEEQRYEFHQEILEDFFDSFFVAGTDTYIVKSGDTLWDLCANRLEIPMWLLQKFNPGLNFGRVNAGRTLHYPLVTPNHIPAAAPEPQEERPDHE